MGSGSGSAIFLRGGGIGSGLGSAEFLGKGFWFQGSRRIRVRAQQDSGGSGNVPARVRAQVPLSSSVWHDTSAGPTDV